MYRLNSAGLRPVRIVDHCWVSLFCRGCCPWGGRLGRPHSLNMEWFPWFGKPPLSSLNESSALVYNPIQPVLGWWFFQILDHISLSSSFRHKSVEGDGAVNKFDWQLTISNSYFASFFRSNTPNWKKSFAGVWPVLGLCAMDTDLVSFCSIVTFF